jgi:hypothetical protein
LETPHWKYLEEARGEKPTMGEREQDSRNSKVIIEGRRLDEALDGSFVFAESGVDKTHVGQDLGGIGNTLDKRGSDETVKGTKDTRRHTEKRSRAFSKSSSS